MDNTREQGGLAVIPLTLAERAIARAAIDTSWTIGSADRMTMLAVQAPVATESHPAIKLAALAKYLPSDSQGATDPTDQACAGARQ